MKHKSYNIFLFTYNLFIFFINILKKKSVFITPSIHCEVRSGNLYINDPAIDNEYLIDGNKLKEIQGKIVAYFNSRNNQVVYLDDIFISISSEKNGFSKVTYGGHWKERSNILKDTELICNINKLKKLVTADK